MSLWHALCCCFWSSTDVAKEPDRVPSDWSDDEDEQQTTNNEQRTTNKEQSQNSETCYKPPQIGPPFRRRFICSGDKEDCDRLAKEAINHVWDVHKFRSEREMHLYVNGKPVKSCFRNCFGREKIMEMISLTIRNATHRERKEYSKYCEFRHVYRRFRYPIGLTIGREPANTLAVVMAKGYFEDETAYKVRTSYPIKADEVCFYEANDLDFIDMDNGDDECCRATNCDKCDLLF